MALKVDYVLRETGSNLFRNITLTLASIITVFISLTLVGSAVVVARAVENATARWEGGIEFIVFMEPEANQDQLDAIDSALAENPDVESHTFVDKEKAFDEFRQLFADSPDLVSNVEPAILPTSFRVKPGVQEAEVIDGLGQTFADDPGVQEIVFAQDAVQKFQTFSRYVSSGMLAVAVILLITAGLLIINTIRMAMFARRREIEVMKLVGATNWFIRVPFMLEGLVQGLIGALPAVGAVLLLRSGLLRISRSDSYLIFQGFTVSAGDVTLVAAGLILVGCLIGVIGSAIAVTRFLDV
ncbi:permease-like cell division protein FtsX [soil metagenome]